MKEKVGTKLVLSLLVLYFSVGLAGFIIEQNSQKRQYDSFKDFTKHYVNTPTGFITEHPLFTFILKTGFLKDINYLKPVNPQNPGIFGDTFDLTKKHLMLDGNYAELSQEAIERNLEFEGYSNYIYFTYLQGKNRYFDPNREVLKALNKNCENTLILPESNNLIYFYFTNCFTETKI